jgi:hypothetical protein
VKPPSSEFNPYGLHAIRIPLEMVSYPGLSAGAKLLYGRLALFRGRQEGGFCRPSLEKLAQAMGTSVDSVDRWLGELVREGFIERKRHRRAVAECVFLPHPVLVDSANPPNQDSPDSAEAPNQERFPDSANLPPRFRKNAPLDSANPDEKSPHAADSTDTYGTENIHHQNIQENVHFKDGDETPFQSLDLDDEEKHSPPPRRNPEEELRAIYREKTGVEISQDVERRIWETCELRGVARTEFIDAVRGHIRGKWHTPAAFLTDFARKIHTKRSRPLEEVTTATPGYAPETGRCAICKGIGYLRFDENPVLCEYCDCALGRDLQRADKRRAQEQAEASAASTTSEPGDDLHSGGPGGRNVS